MRFFLKILTPEVELLQDHVDSVQVPAVDGMYELLYDHSPIFVALHAGPVIVRQSTETEKWFIDGGTCHMQNNQCTIVAKNVIDMNEIELSTLISELKTQRSALYSPPKCQLLEAQIAYKTHNT